jgi:hypothetical protein
MLTDTQMREHIVEVAVEIDEATERGDMAAVRLLADEQRAFINALLERWDAELATESFTGLAHSPNPGGQRLVVSRSHMAGA